MTPLSALLALALAAPPAGGPTPSRPDGPRSVWAVDFVRTLPGQRDRYLEYNRLNWVPMRRAFVEEGIARSFRVLAAPPDSTAEWDVVLMTEYVDEEAYALREEVFERVRARPGYEHRLVDGLGPREMARIVASRELAEPAGSDRAGRGAYFRSQVVFEKPPGREEMPILPGPSFVP